VRIPPLSYTRRMWRIHLILRALLLGAGVAAQAPDPRLTVADVEQATGIKPIHIVAPGSLPGAGPGLNFATGDDKMLLMVNFGPDTINTRVRNQKEMYVI
jgi:hypothetical protein